MKDGWKWEQGYDLTTPLLEVQAYSLNPLSQIQINLGNVDNYIGSTHIIGIYNLLSNRYKVYDLLCSRKNSNEIVSTINKLGNNLNISIDIFINSQNVILTIANNEAVDFQIRNIQSIIKHIY